MCQSLGIYRSSYYNWLHSPESARAIENKEYLDQINKIHKEHPGMGYRRINDELNRNNGKSINDKRTHRLCQSAKIQSNIKWKPKSCTRGAKKVDHVAENILSRNFSAEAPNTKWCTDVSEFKYNDAGDIKKLYLSAIIDLCDKRIVSDVISDCNDNLLVMRTFDNAMKSNHGCHPLCHSDRGFQYTSYDFRQRMEKYQMTQSMSRVGKCIDNAPIEGFWGMLKREVYYGRTFNNREELVRTIKDYIRYYNNGRIQRKLNRLTPMEFNSLHSNIAA